MIQPNTMVNLKKRFCSRKIIIIKVIIIIVIMNIVIKNSNNSIL